MPDGLISCSQAAAFSDPRFIPISKHELKALAFEVNVLRSLIPCQDLNNWEIGNHGIICEFNGRKATFLLHLSAVQKWTREETINEKGEKIGVFNLSKKTSFSLVKL